MKVCLCCQIEKPLPSFYKTKGGIQGVASYCKPCDNAKRSARHAANPKPGRERAVAWRVDNPERKRALDASWYSENRIHARLRQAEYYAENKEALDVKNKQWAVENADSVRVQKQKYRLANIETVKLLRSEHYKKAKASYIANARKREKRIVLATPSWVDFDAIEELYFLREKVTAETGITHHVDHIIPLKGKNVCGLHVHYNLRVIPAAENLRKGNRLEEGIHEKCQG